MQQMIDSKIQRCTNDDSSSPPTDVDLPQPDGLQGDSKATFGISAGSAGGCRADAERAFKIFEGSGARGAIQTPTYASQPSGGLSPSHNASSLKCQIEIHLHQF